MLNTFIQLTRCRHSLLKRQLDTMSIVGKTGWTLSEIVRPTGLNSTLHYYCLSWSDPACSPTTPNFTCDRLSSSPVLVISKNQTIARIITGNFSRPSLIWTNFPSWKTCLFLIYRRPAVDCGHGWETVVVTKSQVELASLNISLSSSGHLDESSTISQSLSRQATQGSVRPDLW